MDSPENLAQIRHIAQGLAKATVIEVLANAEELQAFKGSKGLPAPAVWLGVICAGVFVAIVSGFLLWTASAINQTQQDISAIKTTLQPGGVIEQRFVETDRRLGNLEGFHRPQVN